MDKHRYGSVRHNTYTLKILLEVAAQRGMPPADCLHGSGLEPRQIDDPETEVEVRQEFAVVRNLLARFGAEHPCGLVVGSRHHLTTFGLLGFAQASSPTFRSAVALVVRYLALTPIFSRIHSEELDGEWRMILDDAVLPEDLRRTLLEAEAVTILNMVRELLGTPVPLRQLHFRFACPDYAEIYNEVFGLRPQFGQPRNFLALDAAWLDQPLPQASPLTTRFCEQRCRELLQSRRAREGVSGQVRELLLAYRASIPLEQEVAAALCVTPRTLQRMLAAEGTSFRTLLEEVREALAIELLKTPRMTVRAVADRLGYSEPSGFVRAFKRWRGQPPTAYLDGRKVPEEILTG